MPNSNPIRITDTGLYPVFTLPKKYANKKLFITTTTELVKEGWKLDLFHWLSINGDPIDFVPTPDIDKQELGLCKEVSSLKLALASVASRIKDGATGKPSKVKYSIKFEADDELIDDEFTITSDETNPITFYTKVTFKLGK